MVHCSRYAWMRIGVPEDSMKVAAGNFPDSCPQVSRRVDRSRGCMWGPYNRIYILRFQSPVCARRRRDDRYWKRTPQGNISMLPVSARRLHRPAPAHNRWPFVPAHRCRQQGALVPLEGGFGNSLGNQALRQPGVGLNGLREWLSLVDGLTHLLKLPDRFLDQSHLFEGEPEIVVGLRVLFGRRSRPPFPV